VLRRELKYMTEEIAGKVLYVFGVFLALLCNY
jgi:hypothetical protein